MRRFTPERRRRSERGTTLVELLVSMAIFTACMALVFGAVIIVMRKSADVQKSADAVSELRIAMAQIDREVRSGNVLFSPADETLLVGGVETCLDDSLRSGTCMRIFTQSNGSEKCVQWQITAGDPVKPGSSVLRTRSWATTWQTTGIYSAWATVARGLTLPAGTYPFTLVLDPANPSAYAERLLEVRLNAYDARRNTSVETKSSMSGRNTTYGYNAAQCTPVPPA